MKTKGESMTFGRWFEQHARGQLDADASASLDEVAQAVLLLDKPGSVTIELKMTKTGGRIMVRGQVKSKVPMADPEAGIYFLSNEGLTTNDPMQGSFDDLRPGPGDEPVRPANVDENGEVR